MENTQDIRIIVEQSASGDAGSFKVLYELLVDKVYAYVRYRTRSEDDATDITQEVFVDLYKALPGFTYRSREEFYGFLFTITKRKLAKHYADAHMRGVGEVSFDENIHTEAQVETFLPDTIARALHTLDDVTREILVLHHWSRYTFGEIASLIGMTESAVRVRHHRALAELSASIGSQ